MYTNIKGYLSLTDAAINKINELQEAQSRNAMMGVYAQRADVASKRPAAAAQRVKDLYGTTYGSG